MHWIGSKILWFFDLLIEWDVRLMSEVIVVWLISWIDWVKSQITWVRSNIDWVRSLNNWVRSQIALSKIDCVKPWLIDKDIKFIDLYKIMIELYHRLKK